MGHMHTTTGVAEKYGVSNFDVEGATALFFDIYINTYAKQVDISYPGKPLVTCNAMLTRK